MLCFCFAVCFVGYVDCLLDCLPGVALSVWRLRGVDCGLLMRGVVFMVFSLLRGDCVFVWFALWF